MNIRVHPVRVSALSGLSRPDACFVSVRSKQKKNLRDVCIQSKHRPPEVVVLGMSIGGALATTQVLNEIIKHYRGIDESKEITAPSGGHSLREVPGSDLHGVGLSQQDGPTLHPEEAEGE